MSMGEILTTVNSDPTVPLNEGGVKIVKSIQRGVGTATSIAISEVNPDKCIVLIDGVVTTSVVRYRSDTRPSEEFYYGNSVGGATLASVTANNLTISNVKNTYSWQLIEFY